MKGYHRHSNGGGWVRDEVAVPPHVYVGEKAIIHGGKFHGGEFHGGWFYGGVFHEGVFCGGGEFRGGVFRGGVFRAGVFHDGVFYGGSFRSSPILCPGLIWMINSSGLDEDGRRLFRVGCRWGTLDWHRERYADPSYSGTCDDSDIKEIMAALEHIDALMVIRGGE